MSALKYRPDIDGLRAVAVILVLLYHADLWDVNGGYIGVDVFFVISGFLITSLIVADLKTGSFSFLDFWERRIRRILPALGVVTATTLVAGWFLFLPQDYAVLGQQAASQALFSSNMLFYSLSGYFAAENSTKPLLHTWSLAVEEQYYFIVPFLLAGLFAKVRQKTVVCLAGLTVISFAASVWAVKYYPDAAFYLLPFRAWELLVGSLLAFVPRREEGEHTSKINNIVAFGGLAAILAAGISYTPKTAFPGMAALLPCLGAAAIIYAGRANAQSTYVGRMLSLRPVVFVGLISYSLYLWHWPLLMFAEYVPLIETRSLQRILLLLLSALLSYLTWKYVEQPCRRKSGKEGRSDRRFIYKSAITGLALFAVAGIVLWQMKGFPARWSESALQYANGKDDRSPHTECVNTSPQDVRADGLCQTNPEAGKPQFLVWGDSFSDSMAPAFFDLSKKYGKNGYIASRHSCAPILDMRQGHGADSEICKNFNDAVLDLIKRHKIRHVILIGNWNSWFRIRDAFFVSEGWYDKYRARFDNMSVAGAQRTADLLIEAGAKPYVMVAPPTLSFNAPLLLAFENKFAVKDVKSYTPIEKYKKDRENGIGKFMNANADGKVVFIDSLPIFCQDDRCISQYDGSALYFDRNHLTTHGAALAEPLFETLFKKMR